MTLLRMSILVCFLPACAGGATDPAEPSAPSLEAAESPGEQGLAEPSPGESVSAATERDARCTGSALDLDALAGSRGCHAGGNASPLPEGVSLSLESTKLEAVASERASYRVLIKNNTASDAELVLDASCGFRNLISSKLFSNHDIRLDHVGPETCREPRDCAGSVVHVTLAAGGTATLSVAVPTQISVFDDACAAMPGRLLEPGSYNVRVSVAGQDEPLKGTLKVAKLVRLSAKKCAHYAKTVAAKAEPSLKERAQVQRDLLSKCEKQPPVKTLADCQMSAKTEEALAACQK